MNMTPSLVGDTARLYALVSLSLVEVLSLCLDEL